MHRYLTQNFLVINFYNCPYVYCPWRFLLGGKLKVCYHFTKVDILRSDDVWLDSCPDPSYSAEKSAKPLHQSRESISEINRSSHQKCSIKKYCSWTFPCNIPMKTPALNSLFNKVAETPTQLFSCEFCKIFKSTYILMNICEWLLLNQFPINCIQPISDQYSISVSPENVRKLKTFWNFQGL